MVAISERLSYDSVLSGSTKSSPGTPFVYDENVNSSPTKAKTVILFGETGAGKSSVINLIAGRAVAETSPDLAACTLEAKEYSFTLPASNTSLRIFDTAGLGEPKPESFLGAIEKAYRLIGRLRDAGGVDLLLFCIKGCRITDSVVRDYRLFFEFLCNKEVPVALIITGLENERESMDDWWGRNDKKLEEYSIKVVDHACITALADGETTRQYAEKQSQSRDALLCLLGRTLADPRSGQKQPFTMEVLQWLVSFLGKLLLFLTAKSNIANTPNQTKISKRLQRRCGLNEGQAQEVAKMIIRAQSGKIDTNAQ